MDHLPYPAQSEVSKIKIPFLLTLKDRHCVLREGKLPTLSEGRGTCEKSSTGIQKPDAQEGLVPTDSLRNILDCELIQEHPKLNVKDWAEGFWTYPFRQGWVLNDTARSSWCSCPNPEAARRAQEWLYFGLLRSTVFSGLNACQCFKEDPDGCLFLDSTPLPKLISAWILKVRASRTNFSLDESKASSDRDDSYAILILLAKVLLECDLLDSFSEPSRSISLSIKILVDLFVQSIMTGSKNKLGSSWKIWKLGPTPLLEERMLAAGWCPHQIQRIWGQYTASTVHYLSALPRGSTFGGVHHEACSADRCVSASVDPKTYEPRHSSACGSGAYSSQFCRMVEAPQSEIASIIDQGGTPLISIERSSDGEMKLQAIKFKSGLRYVALSHVWSGGLGNVQSNSMQSCQLQRIIDLLSPIREDGSDDLDRDIGPRKLEGAEREIRSMLGLKPKPESPLLFWIDTLCVPVGSQYRSVYLSALYQMAKIYLEAQCVLVIDPELQEMTHRNLSDEQIFASVLCSSWNSRSWTFQEACMARVFYIQFADGYCVIDQKWHEIDGNKSSDTKADASKNEIEMTGLQVSRRHETRRFLLQEVSQWFGEMPLITRMRSHDPRILMSHTEDWMRFTLAWNGLRNRSTTKIDDLFGITAIMVDLRPREILELPRNERMKAIIRAQATLPLPLLYQAGPKLRDSQDQISWAPSRIEGERIEMGNGHFQLSGPGIEIKATQGQSGPAQAWPHIYLVDTRLLTGNRFLIKSRNTTAKRYVELLIEESNHLNEPPIRQALLIIDDALFGRYSSTASYAPGACLLVHGLNGKIYETSYLCPLKAFGGDFDDQFEAKMTQNRDQEWIVSELQSSELKWDKCVIRVDCGMSM